ncbi:unnamed protein product [Urochloa decumbens]|uniref:Homeobox domain-containing protein n=1 Tax=Urochloa decumbens TaxID=240449 RepID=A0ABC8VFX5_9POAL
MSSLTTVGSSEEHSVSFSVSVDELGTHLSLGIGGGGGSSRRPRTVQLFGEVLSLQENDDDTHHGGARRRDLPAAAPASRRKREYSGSGDLDAALAATSRPNKKAKKFQGDGDDSGDRRSPTNDGGGGRKKLRLTAAQAGMLEDSFRAHNILSQAEKQDLARRVGLSARQVEVWFQNRRARTKLKQTEVDCELLRRWCDRLTDENARLRRVLAGLRAAPARLAVVCAACCHNQQAAAGEMA